MIIEEREYRILPGKREEFWQRYSEIGLPIQTKFLPRPLGFFFVEIGASSNFVHMWAYNNLQHREHCREILHHDEEWQAYVKISHEYILEMNVRILRQLTEYYSKPIEL